MRVTKLIKDYVTEEVQKVFKEKTSIEKEYEEKAKIVEEEVKKVREELYKIIEGKKEELEKKYNDFIFTTDTYNLITTDCYRYSRNRNKNIVTLEEKANKAKEDREYKANQAVKNILISLEMGEITRKNIAEMIAKLSIESEEQA